MSQALDTADPILLEVQGALAGRYAVERELGRGGMGTVYLARDIRLDRLVLEQAQRTAGGRRLELLGALENARLGLLRLKSRVGNADELERELEEVLRRS